MVKVGFEFELTKDPTDHVLEIASRIAPLAFRRPSEPGKVESFVNLARPAIVASRDFTVVIRVPPHAVLNARQFLFHGGKPG